MPVFSDTPHHQHGTAEAPQPHMRQGEECSERYRRGGAAGVEGSLYQVKLLTLFLFRGIKRNYDFKLATEMKDAYKFDDLVFRYSTTQGERESIVLQAKHRLDASNTITLDDLLCRGPKGDFNLTKYFYSYQKIKKDKSFGRIKKAIIFTNIDLDANAKQYMEPDSVQDDLLSLEGTSPGSAYYKLTDAVLSRLTPLLEEGALSNVADDIVDHILEEKTIRVQKDSLWEKYIAILKKEILDIPLREVLQFKSCIFDAILEDSQTKLFMEYLNFALLKKKQEKFRCTIKRKMLEYDTLQAKTKSEKKQKNKLLDIKNYFYNKISDVEYKFTLNDLNYFLKNFTIKISKPSKHQTSEPIRWPDNNVPKADIKDFLECLVLAVNQPSEKMLSKIIFLEISPEYGSNNLITEYVADKLEKEMLDWFKTISENKEGTFCTPSSGAAILEELTSKVNALSCVPQSIEAWERVHADRVEFKEEVVADVQRLLAPEKKIIHLTSNSNGLIMMKLFYAVDEPLNKYLYVNSDALSSHKTQSRIVRSFELMNYSGIVIESSHVDSFINGVTQQLCQELSEILTKDSGRVFILVTPHAEDFTYPLPADPHYNKINLQHNFEDLTEDYRRKLRGREIVKFQGSLTVLSSILNEHTTSQIDAKTLYQLINNEIIVIGRAPQFLRNLASAYMKIYERVPRDNVIEALESSADCFYLISGFMHIDILKIREELIQMLGLTTEFYNLSHDKVNLFSREIDTKTGFTILSGDNIEDHKECFHFVCEQNPSHVVYWIDVSSGHFLLQHLYSPRFYIPRHFSYKEHFIMDVEKLKQNVLQSNSACYIFDGLDQSKFAQLLCIESESEKSIFLDKIVKQNIVIFPKLCDGLQLNNYNKCNRPVHQFKVNNQLIKWNGSNCGLEELRQCIAENQSKEITCTEDRIEEITDRIVIIADRPGMGKTTTLASLSEHMLPSYWILRINFKDCHSALVHLPVVGSVLSLDVVMQFLSEVDSTGVNCSLTREILSMALQQERGQEKGILFLFDGYDEISAEEQPKVIRLLLFLKQETSARMWITTRPYMEQQLENCLSTFSIKLHPLTLAQQRDFLIQYWLDRFSLTLKQYDNLKLLSLKVDLNSLTSHLLEKANFLIAGHLTTLMEIPLQLRLLAEGFQMEIFQVLCNSPTLSDPFKNFTILDLYEHFIEQNYNAYFREKINFSHMHNFVKDISSESFNRFHQYKAFESLFSERKDFLARVYNFEDISFIKREDDIKCIGIIQSGSGETVSFIHRTLSEYFVASLFVRILHENALNFSTLRPTVISILYEEMFEERNQVIRKFIDQMLAKNLPLHSAIINNKCFPLKFSLNEMASNTDVLGRTALHLAVQYYNTSFVQGLLGAGCDGFKSDSFGKTALHYASPYGSDIVLYLLDYYADIDIHDNIFGTQLLLNAEVGDNMFDKSQCEQSQLIKLVNCADIGGKVALHYVIKNKNRTLAGLFLKYGSYISSLTLEEMMYVLQENQGLCGLHEVYSYLVIKNVNKVHLVNKVATIFSTVRGHIKCLDAIRLYNPELLSMDNMVNCYNFPLVDDNALLTSAKWFESTANMSEANFEVFSRLTLDGGLCNTFIFLLEKCRGYMSVINICQYFNYAVQQNQVSLVDYLWRNYRENTTDASGSTALHRAVRENNIKFVKFYCENGADLDALDSEGKTPLHLAINGNYLDIIMYLRKVGGTLSPSFDDRIINIIDKTVGKSGLHCIRQKLLSIALEGIYLQRDGDEIEDICNWAHTILQTHCNDINKPTQNGDSLLHVAMEKEISVIVKYLVDQGASIHFRDKKGRNPMERALTGGFKNKIFTFSSLLAYCMACGFNYESPYISHPILLKFHNLFNCRNTPKHYPESDILTIFSWNRITDVVNSKCETLYHIYARRGDLAAIKYISSNNFLNNPIPSSNQQDAKGNTPLHLAAQGGHEGVARWLLQHGAAFNRKNLFGQSPGQLARQGKHDNVTELLKRTKGLFNSIIENCIEQLKEYLCDGESVNLRDNSGKSPLHWAAYCGFDEMAQELLNYGANVEATDVLQRTALQIAAGRDHMDVLYTLLTNGASFNPKGGPRTNRENNAGRFLRKVENLFHRLQVDEVKDFLNELQKIKETDLRAFNAIMNCKTNEKLTLLNYAVKQNKANVVFFLLGNGSPLDVPETQVRNMSSVLSEFFMFIMVKTMKKQVVLGNPLNNINVSTRIFEGSSKKMKAIINYRDCHGLTILHKTNDFYTLKYFITNGSDVNARDATGSTPLHCAARKGKLDHLMWLQHHGADLTAVTNSDDSVLHFASFPVHPHIVDYLMSVGAKVNASNCQGDTPLHFVVSNLLQSSIRYFHNKNSLRNHQLLLEYVSSTLEIFLKNHPSINSKNKKGCTVLDIAISTGYLPIVERLVQYGASVDICLLRRAISEGQFHVVKWLMDHFSALFKEKILIFHEIISSNCFNLSQWLLRHDAEIESRASEDCAIFQVKTNRELNSLEWLLAMNSEVSAFSPEEFVQDGSIGIPVAYRTVIEWLSTHKIDVKTIRKRNGTVFHIAVLPAFLNIDDLKHELPVNHHWLNQLLYQLEYPSGNKFLIIVRLPRGVSNLFLMFNEFNGNSWSTNDDFTLFKEQYLHSTLGLNEEECKLNLMTGFTSHCRVDLNLNSGYGIGLLCQATKKGYLQIVQWLISLYNDSDWTQGVGRNLIHDASKYGHLHIVEWLEAQGVDVNASASNGRTALQAAVSEGHYHVIKWLVDHGALNVQEKETILQQVLLSTRLDVSGWLTEYCDRTNMLIINNSAMFLQSKIFGLPSWIKQKVMKDGFIRLPIEERTVPSDQVNNYFNKLLTVESIGVNMICNVGCILIMPTRSVDSDVIKWITTGVPESIINFGEISVSYRDITFNMLDLMKWFVSNGAQVQDSLLNTAASGGHLKVMQWLVEKFNLNVLSVSGDQERTCLHEAVALGDLDMTKWLKSKNADIKARTQEKRTIFHEAAKFGHFHIMYWLLDNDLEINSCAEDDITPFHEAVPLGNINLLKWMLGQGADVERTTRSGMSALHIAASFGHLTIVKWLIEIGLDVNSVADGRTPLHEAVSYGDLDVFELLYSSGANVNFEILYQEATDQEHFHIMHWMEEKGLNK